MSAVASVEPSSTTTTSNGGQDCPRTLSIASARKASPSRTAMTTLTRSRRTCALLAVASAARPPRRLRAEMIVGEGDDLGRRHRAATIISRLWAGLDSIGPPALVKVVDRVEQQQVLHIRVSLEPRRREPRGAVAVGGRDERRRALGGRDQVL